MNIKGTFIVFEGPERCGKTTQLELLKKFLESKDYQVKTTKEPGGSKAGNAIRKILLDKNYELASATDFLLFSAARKENLRKTIRPALAEGKLVLCDRFLLSSLVYQGYAGDLSFEFMKKVSKIVTEDIGPDLRIVISIPAKTSLQRLNRGSKDRFESKKKEFHQKISRGYKKIAKKMPHTLLIDGRKSKREIHQKIKKETKTIL